MTFQCLDCNYRLSESRKLCLNLCSQRSLRSSLSLVNNLTPLGLSHLKTLFPEGRINFKSFFLKIFRFSELPIFWSSLFHSVATEGKKEFSKKSVLLCFTKSFALNWVFVFLRPWPWAPYVGLRPSAPQTLGSQNFIVTVSRNRLV